jgi:hypothetical protein
MIPLQQKVLVLYLLVLGLIVWAVRNEKEEP